MYKMMAQLLGAMLICWCAGCNLLVDGSEQCRDKACDAANWLILNLRFNRIVVDAVDGSCSLEYRVDYANADGSADRLATSFSVRPGDLRVAITTSDGVLHLSNFGQTAADAELLDQHALAVGWSADGQRLAVLAGDPTVEPLDLELLVFSPALDLQSTTTLGDSPGFEVLPPSYHLSWSTDQVWIAVTNAQDGAGRLVNVETDAVVPLEEAFNAAFLSDRSLVIGSGAPGAPRLDRAEIGQAGIESRAPLDIREQLLDADPAADVMLTIAQFGINYAVSLRTTTLGPNTLGSPGFGEYELIFRDGAADHALAASADLLNCAD